MKLSIVFGTYNRAHLLRRSLETYAQQPFKDFEIIVMDDSSIDDTFDVVKSFMDSLDIKYVFINKDDYRWRDSSSFLNFGIRAAKGEIVVPTHPEVMVGKNTLQEIADKAQHWSYICAKPYYLTKEDQKNIDTSGWRDDVLNITRREGYYEQPSAEHSGNPQYAHAQMEKHAMWDSWVFGGMTKATWRRIGGLSESEVWGPVDISFANRRKILDIPNITLQGKDTMVIHQNHDEGTPRDVKKAIENTKIFTYYTEAIEHNV